MAAGLEKMRRLGVCCILRLCWRFGKDGGNASQSQGQLQIWRVGLSCDSVGAELADIDVCPKRVAVYTTQGCKLIVGRESLQAMEKCQRVRVWARFGFRCRRSKTRSQVRGGSIVMDCVTLAVHESGAETLLDGNGGSLVVVDRLPAGGVSPGRPHTGCWSFHGWAWLDGDWRGRVRPA